MNAAIAVVDKSDVFDRIHRLGPALAEQGVRRVGLFGSFVRGEQREGSDVDLLIEFRPECETFRRFMAAADLLEEHLGRRVEVVTPGGLSRHIGPHILREVEYVQIAD